MIRWIDADALKKDIARLHVLNDEAEIRRIYEYNPHVTTTDFEETLVSVFDAIDDAPSIDIEPKRGEWIDEADEYDASFGIHDYRCSNCNSYADEYIGGHEWYTAGKPNFCPYCGADMRERKEKE